MPTDTPKPIIFLAFATPPPGARGHLRDLNEENSRLSQTLKAAEANGLCEVMVEPNAGLDKIVAVFNDHTHRIAIFHYAGHANNYELLLADEAKIDGRGLAAFLGQQQGLQLIFLNACSTQPQVEALLAANIPAIIATAQAIQDEQAMNFADHFYQALAKGSPIETAYNKAEAVIKAAVGSTTTRSVYRDAVFPTGTSPNRWPWDLYVKPGAEIATQWSLPEAVKNFLFQLPLPDDIGLPETPFRHLHWFEREHARIFFGRGRAIRKLYDQVTSDGDPIILFYGQSGVGKSSLLAAGLLPRLEADYTIRYTRRDRDRGLLGTLAHVLGATDSWQPAQLLNLWHSTEQTQPLVIILDQAEELFTRPNPDQPDELVEFVEALQLLFAHHDQRPQGKLILGFRKEWLADINRAISNQHLPRSTFFLTRLDQAGIIEAVNAVSQLQKYGLTVAPELPGIIADDLLEDPDSPVAPTLQILLTKLWDRAKADDYDHPHFTQNLYQDLKRQGILLSDFLDQQLAALEKWNSDIVTSGLALDVLAYHTTPQGTAEQRSQAQLLETYAHRSEKVPPLVRECEDLYLLVDPSKNQPNQPKASRLAHDALAPLVRQRFDESDAPGQRARRILESRAIDWVDEDNKPKKGNPLDEVDLGVVEAGLLGMRGQTGVEKILIDASEMAVAEAQRKEKRQRQIIQVSGALAAVFVIVAIIAGIFAYGAINQATQAQDDLSQARTTATADFENLRATQTVVEAAATAELKQLEGQINEVQKTVTAVAELQRESEQAIEQLNTDAAAIDLAIQSTESREPETALLYAGQAASRYPEPELEAVAPVQVRKTLLRSLSNPLRRVFSGHQDAVGSVAFDPQGEFVLTGSWDNTARLWSVESGEMLHELSGHQDRVGSVAFDPQGRYVATGSEDGTARLWFFGIEQMVEEAKQRIRPEWRAEFEAAE